MKIIQRLMYICLLVTVLANNARAGVDQMAKNTADEIRREAVLSSSAEIGNPLPLIGHWNSGEMPNTFEPSYQMKLIEQGHHLLPWFHLDTPGRRSAITINNYYDSIQKAAKLKLPISFLSSQWERLLSDDVSYRKLAKEVNPNVVDNKGRVEKKVSPMGAKDFWRDVAIKWTDTKILKSLQVSYPDPPVILFISNNEHSKLKWYEANTDYRFVKVFGLNTTDKEKKEIFAKHWIDRYRLLQQGLKEGLDNTAWKNKSLFVGYNAFGVSVMGRWPGWKKYSLDTEKYASAWIMAWDGASAPFYTHNWDASTDNNIWGPMVGAMNWVFMKKEALRLNPDYWFEISIWDGHQPGKKNDKRRYYKEQGQAYSPERYSGMVKYALWLLRPRLIREFRNPDQWLSETESYFMQIVNAVDEVYSTAVLKKFWRKAKLIANTTVTHPYNAGFLKKYAEEKRWFLLNTNYDAKRPWNLQTTIPVFSIALVLGDSPNREWLLYCFSPLDDKTHVQVDIPEYKRVSVSSAKKGIFFHIVEAEDKVISLR